MINRLYASGPSRGPTKIKLRNLDSCVVNAIRCEADEINRWSEETHWLARRQNVEGPAAARARSRAACGGGERARRSESTYSQLVVMMSRIVAHKRLRDGSLEKATCAPGTDRAKTNACRGKPRLFSRFSSISCVH